MAASIAQQFSDIEEKIDGILEQVNADPGASPTLKAVVGELHSKTRDARDATKGADERTIRDCVLVAEEAADGAKRAVEAEPEMLEANRRAVIEVHDALRDLKSVLP